ncbi:hypothetical protein AA313_de0204052 [Arthrobotrys entomopaga]|nr:hypothetical protein AA313_de0204052 [Arthrobotrys entomopaga]
MVDNQNPEASEALLPELAKIIAPRSKSGSRTETLRDLRSFFEYTRSFRKSSKPLDALGALTKDSALVYHGIIDAFLRTVTQAKEPLTTLKFIFHSELGIPEHELETKQLILTVIADIPFTFANWVGTWIQLTRQGNWEGVWAVTNYVQKLQSSGTGETKWQSAEVKWASIHLARIAGVTTYLLLQFDEGQGAVSRAKPNTGQGGLETKPSQKHGHAQGGSSQTPHRVRGDTRRDPPETTPVSGLRTPSESARRARVPQVTPRSRPPTSRPSRNIVDTIITEYAQTPRIKYNSEEERRERLLEFNRSEEEFNRKLKQNYRDYRSREGRENRPITESSGESVRRDAAAEAILGRPPRKGQEQPKLVDLRTKILRQEQEIDDDKFEQWAMGLLDEKDEEHDQGDDARRYYY